MSSDPLSYDVWTVESAINLHMKRERVSAQESITCDCCHTETYTRQDLERLSPGEPWNAECTNCTETVCVWTCTACNDWVEADPPMYSYCCCQMCGETPGEIDSKQRAIDEGRSGIRFGRPLDTTRSFLSAGLMPFSTHKMYQIQWNEIEREPLAAITCRPRMELRRLAKLLLLINHRMSTSRRGGSATPPTALPPLPTLVWYLILAHFEIRPIPQRHNDSLRWDLICDRYIDELRHCGAEVPQDTRGRVDAYVLQTYLTRLTGDGVDAPIPWWCAEDEFLDYAGFRVLLYGIDLT
eukprot:m.145677 g.145677  ORF g.145677 m.145677 type:complete len:296 (-) comp11630_c0_seq3:1896-2783(-)